MKRLPKSQQESFGSLYHLTRHNTILEPKTTLLLHLGVAMA
jgi:hypothetical protein